MSAMSQITVADAGARGASATPLGTADDGLYHPAKYPHGADNLYVSVQTNQSPTTSPGAPVVANAIVTSMPQSPVWHTTTLAETEIPVSTQKPAITTDIFESSSIAISSETPSATAFNFPVSSTPSVANNVPQQKQLSPAESRVYHLLIVFFLAFLIILVIVSWFKRQAERKKPILATYQQPRIQSSPQPNVSKERFVAALCQSRGLWTGVLATGAEAISAIRASFSSSKFKSESSPKDGATMVETRSPIMEKILEQNTRISERATMKFSNLRRWISYQLGRQRVDDEAVVEKDEKMASGSSSLHEEFESSSYDSADEQTHLDTSHPVVTKIRPPPPAIIVERKSVLEDNAIIPPETVCLEESCTSSTSSDTSRGSETKSLEKIDEYHEICHSPSVVLLTVNVYRIEMEFAPRRDTQLGVEQGDEVILTRLFEDGWAFCELLRTKQQGLVPRACLSVWPSRRHNTPPSVASLKLVPPTANSRPTTPVSPISPIFPRFYSSASSTASLS
ncbi:SH3 domain protein [Penicillium herquei]|nr:SH3 domain protein [Penicillium herquei]